MDPVPARVALLLARQPAAEVLVPHAEVLEARAVPAQVVEATRRLAQGPETQKPAPRQARPAWPQEALHAASERAPRQKPLHTLGSAP